MHVDHLVKYCEQYKERWLNLKLYHDLKD